MSEYRRRSHEDYSGEPVIIERSPQVRYRIVREKAPPRERLTFGSKLYNLFRSRKKEVRIIEEVPVRSRRQERRSLTPPPSPRRPFHTMAPDPEDDIYTPLPPKLPLKAKKYHDDKPERKKYHDDNSERYVVEERSPQRYRKVRVYHDHLDDEEAHPMVESPSPPRKRDSGKYFMSGARLDGGIERVRPEYERERPDPEVERLRSEIDRLRREKRDAELTALAAKDKAERVKADLEYEKRQRSLEKRERLIAEREKRLSQARDQLVEVRRPRQDVVVVHNPPSTMVQTRDSNRSALDRARDDFQRGQPAKEDRRPGTGDRRSRGQSIIIVDDENDRGYRRRQF